jgi:hypothetical protein
MLGPLAVNPPGPVQLMVKGGVPLLTLTVKVAEAPTQICWFAGWTTQLGGGAIGTVNVQTPGHPSRVMLSVKVNEPEAPAVTLTVLPLAAPLMVPLPLIVQLCVTVPPAGWTAEV